MNDLAEISYKIVFLGLLAFLVGMTMPALAQDPGNVGGPGAPTILEGRGAIAPLPAPSIPASSEPTLDTTPADEVRSLPDSPKSGEKKAESAKTEEATPDAIEPSAGPIFLDGRSHKPWWRFW